tara:strand:- start:343 stop:732 length:390 start_codon:yes stop_codon:yes gene_type:complete
MALNRTTLISIVATSIIIGLSIGLTSMFGPTQTSLEKHKQAIIDSDDMKIRCKQFKNIMNTTEQVNGVNNVMNYNVQRLHGQCYLQIGDGEKPVDLLKMTGCHGDGFVWKLKEDSSIFDFCPDMKEQIQ